MGLVSGKVDGGNRVMGWLGDDGLETKKGVGSVLMGFGRGSVFFFWGMGSPEQEVWEWDIAQGQGIGGGSGPSRGWTIRVTDRFIQGGSF